MRDIVVERIQGETAWATDHTVNYWVQGIGATEDRPDIGGNFNRRQGEF
jgi:hypothetical protein